jgi:hypothetical protein
MEATLLEPSLNKKFNQITLNEFEERIHKFKGAKLSTFRKIREGKTLLAIIPQFILEATDVEIDFPILELLPLISVIGGVTMTTEYNGKPKELTGSKITDIDITYPTPEDSYLRVNVSLDKEDGFLPVRIMYECFVFEKLYHYYGEKK